MTIMHSLLCASVVDSHYYTLLLLCLMTSCAVTVAVACVGITRWKSLRQQVAVNSTAFEMADVIDIPYVLYGFHMYSSVA